MLSVIVTTYNRKEQLTATINSILSQTIGDFELIVVDNFSNYDFFELIDSFKDKRIRPFQNKNNGIISINRNFAISQAKGEILAFCDDDDMWFSNKLEKCMKYIPEYDVVYHCFKTTTGEKMRRKPLGNKPCVDLISNNEIIYSSVVIKKSILDRVGFFDEKSEMVAIEDWDYWIRVSLITNKFKCINENLGSYYIGTGNVSNTVDGVKKLTVIFDKYSNVLDYADKLRAEALFEYNVARFLHKKHMFNEAIAKYKQALYGKLSLSIKIRIIVFLFLSKIEVIR